MRRYGPALAIVVLHVAWTVALQAQGPARPGASGLPQFRMAQTDATIGGRPGSQRPRVPITVRPGGTSSGHGGLPPPPRGVLPAPTPDMPEAWAILFEVEQLGPPQGLTLQQSINRLVASSIVLRAKALEIPQAQADVLTAGMHANPIVYFDKQLIGYQPYNTTTNPGGPSQYDFNVAYPADLSRKRRARVEVACAAERVVEALYQDAVRLEVDHVGRAYIDVLECRLALRTTRDALARLDQVRQQQEKAPDANGKGESQRRQLFIQRHTLSLAAIDAEAALRTAKRNLSLLLGLPTERAAELELHGSIRDQAGPPPPLAELVSMALANRPDLAAYRLGAVRSEADIRLAKANVLPDVYLLYQPFTYQDNSPFNAPSSTSWAAGATVVLPLFDRNQGNIRHAATNAQQSRLEAAAVEQRVRSEVEAAYDEYMTTKAGIREIEQQLVPQVEMSLGEHLQEFRAGKLDATSYLYALRDLDDLGRQYRELLIRHRRSMLAINTAVGLRVLP